jgi:apolipoprotein N-acyltransferase
MIVILCTLLSGGMFYLAEGLNNIWALGWIASVPLLWLAYGHTPRWQLCLAGVVAFAWGQVYLVQCYGAFSLPLVLRIAVPPSLLFGAVLLFIAEVRNRLPATAALFAFPAAWTAIEYILGSLLPDGPFTSLANAQVSFPAAIQVASLFGFAGITFLLCLFANAAALLLRRDWRVGGIGTAVCAVALVFGIIRLQQPQGPSLHVVALADTGARIRSWKAKTIADSLAASTTYAARIRELAAKGGRIDLAAIPEGAIAMRQEWRAHVLAPLAAAARDTGTMIVVGTAVPDPVLNRAIAFSPDGTAISYDKRHPLQPIDREVPGTAPGLLGDGRAMAICKDMDFPASIRADVQSGIRVMVVPASDFSRDDWIHARMAILRGVENGFAILRPAFNGVETVSDAYGRVLASTNTSRFGMITLVADVPDGPGPTLYTRIGDVFAWFSIAASLLMAAAVLGRKSRASGNCLNLKLGVQDKVGYS